MKFCVLRLSLLILCMVGVSCQSNQGENKNDLQSQVVETEVVYVSDPDKVLEGPTLNLPKQIINLKDGGLLFLKVSIQYADLVRPEGEENLTPRILDTILLASSAYSETNLRTPKQKEEFRLKLKEEIAKSIESYATIHAIYFEEFLIK